MGDERFEPVVARCPDRERADQRGQTLELARGGRREERLEIAEVLEDRAQRHAGPLGDAGSRRPEVTLVDQVQHRIDDGDPGTVRASNSAVDREVVCR